MSEQTEPTQADVTDKPAPTYEDLHELAYQALLHASSDDVVKDDAMKAISSARGFASQSLSVARNERQRVHCQSFLRMCNAVQTAVQVGL